jgi:NAD(P)-dependent dehydrogenase (short-subunit alcohol dehydrogenase family)
MIRALLTSLSKVNRVELAKLYGFNAWINFQGENSMTKEEASYSFQEVKMKVDQAVTPQLVLVTGAAHRIGRVIALALARNGYAIGLHHLTSAKAAQQTAREIEDIGMPAILLQADLRDPNQIDRLFQELSGLPYPLTGLVNSAAIMPVSRLDNLSVELWDEIFALNLRAAWLCSQKAAHLIQPRNGWIINITDAGTCKVWKQHAAYNLSKSALNTLTRLLARTYAPQIRVNAVAPGLILPPSEMPVETWQKLVQRLPLSKTGKPEDIAQAVIFLVNNPAITGQIISIDAGFQLL